MHPLLSVTWFVFAGADLRGELNELCVALASTWEQAPARIS